VQCGTSGAKPAKSGIFKGDLRGLWFIAANLVHDMAALNEVERLRWDVCGAMPYPDTPLRDNAMAFFDELAALTRPPDASFEKSQGFYERDDRAGVPQTVFNPLLNRPESAHLPAA
jgi:hypothetical protein